MPGYFGAWAKQYRWREYAAAWDAYFEGLAITRNAEKLEAARKQAVEQAEELQALIAYELRGLQRQITRERARPAEAVDKSDALQRLASALRDASAARITALGGGES